MITLRMHAPGTFGAPLLEAPDGATLLVQTDYDYPSIAGTFGWWIGAVPTPAHADRDALGCVHDGTDGTIPCDACGVDASTFIDAAYAWMEDHDGATADDPGYWG